MSPCGAAAVVAVCNTLQASQQVLSKGFECTQDCIGLVMHAGAHLCMCGALGKSRRLAQS